MKRMLEGETAIVTGGTSGIGRAIVHAFCREGAEVIFFGTNEESAAVTIKEAEGTVPYFIKVDVSKKEAILQGVDEALKKLGSCTILVNCAGVTRDGLLMKMSEEDWDFVLTVNLKSCFLLSQALSRPMIRAKRGKIINVSSVVGLMGNPGQTNYAASKAGIIGFTKSLAKELAGRVQVNCIAPGFVETKMTDQLSSTQKEMILKEIPMGRMGTPQEIANVALFLASPLSSYVTGQTIAVDGGMVMF